MRTGAYRIILICLFFILAGVLFFVQVIRGSYYHRLAQKNYIRLIPQDAYRGRIFDRNNNVMADNILSFDVVAMPDELKDQDSVFSRLSDILELDKESLYRIYDRGYVNSFSPVTIAEGVSKPTAIILQEESLDLPGIRVEVNVRRFYPFGTCASHVLGYMGEIDRSRITKLKGYGYDIKDKVGYSGMEEVLDLYLRGEKGGQQVEVDNRGRQVRLLGYKPPSAGKDAQITIDLELQQIADQLLEGRKGAVVLMDARNGEILVMSSFPSFDPNVFVDRKDKAALREYLTSGDAPLFNRVTSSALPPGSVFKAITALAAYRAREFKSSMTYVCPGKMRIGDRYFKCWSHHGAQDFNQAMAHSCDVYFYRLGLRAGVESMFETARDFGFGISTGIDLPHESLGFIPSRMWKRIKFLDNWYDGDTANFSIGQGYVLTTPLQLARMMAAVGNGGYLVVPHLVKSINGEAVHVKEPSKIKISDAALKMVSNSLRFPVSFDDGTAGDLDIEGWDVCAKTGTAQVTGAESHGWVSGFFPKDNPRYAFCILLENVGSSHVACVLGKQLFQEAKRRSKLL